MDSMIEKCTKAAMAEVCRQLGGRPIPGVPAPPAGPDSWAAQGDPGCIDFALVTTAVIKAMREPTEGMNKAGGSAASFDDGWMGEDVGEYRAPKVYKAMIDAALATDELVKGTSEPEARE